MIRNYSVGKRQAFNWYFFGEIKQDNVHASKRWIIFAVV